MPDLVDTTLRHEMFRSGKTEIPGIKFRGATQSTGIFCWVTPLEEDRSCYDEDDGEDIFGAFGVDIGDFRLSIKRG